MRKELTLREKSYNIDLLYYINYQNIMRTKMSELKWPYKKVHLDFHTAPEIPDVGQDFDGKLFASTLKNSGVESLTCFAKCQHGCHYYPSETGFRHPHLHRDLLGEMIASCHAKKIEVEIYYDICGDKHIIKTHPERRQVGMDGNARAALCINNEYANSYIFPAVAELMENYNFEGLFFDSLWYIDWHCSCKNCITRAIREGLDHSDKNTMVELSRKIHLEFMEEMTNFIRERNNSLRIMYNSRYHSPHFRKDSQYYTHLEIEALSTHKGWGYFCFPTFAKYIRNLDKPYYGMAGRFNSWGSTGFMLEASQMIFESARFIANGSGVSIGDHLHPRGKLDAAVYGRIKEVFDYAENFREHSHGSEPVLEAAILMEPQIEWDGAHFGLSKLLMEEHILFDLPDRWKDWNEYKLLIIPDYFCMDDEMREKISVFLKAGGSVIGIGRGVGNNPESAEWLEKTFGIGEYCETNFSTAFCLPEIDQHSGLEDFHYEINDPVSAPLKGGSEHGKLFWPYWETSKERPCGHTYAPWDKNSGFPAIVQKGKCVYIAFPIGKPYFSSGNPFFRKLMRGIIKKLLPEKIVDIHAPGSVETILNRKGNNFHLHLIRSSTALRGTPHMELIESGYPLRNIPVSLIIKEKINEAFLIPENVSMPFESTEDGISFSVPELDIHQMVFLKRG